jgi:hypothetical protein
MVTGKTLSFACTGLGPFQSSMVKLVLVHAISELQEKQKDTGRFSVFGSSSDSVVWGMTGVSVFSAE